ncbi:MAG TPA: hypothetical protein DCL77_02040 [Prolixibacteraceae bacterium]|nr:hypothetical protein [Prolixibacteraceae bacterium]
MKNGKIVLDDPVAFSLHIQRYENKPIDLHVGSLSKRSGDQNRYYFGVIVRMVYDRLIDLGYQTCDLVQRQDEFSQNLTLEDVHEFLKQQFNRSTLFSEATGEILGSVGASTKTLATVDFIAYTERIKQWAAEHLDIDIPEPDASLKYIISPK